MRLVVFIISTALLGLIATPSPAVFQFREGAEPSERSSLATSIAEVAENNLATLFPAPEDSRPDTALSRQPSTPVRLAQMQQRRGFWSPFEAVFGSLSSAPPRYRRQTVWYQTQHQAGTIVIDTSQRFLYHVQGNGTAVRYGVGVGRLGFSWKGTAYVGDKREWPGWTPPASMREREPWLPVHMPGGPDNPLGARALYLYQGGQDTLYRIHGTNQPETIGQALSSGCIRMLNEDVQFLYEQVSRGTKVVVL